MIAFILLTLILTGLNSEHTPLLNIYQEAIEKINDGSIEESIPLLDKNEDQVFSSHFLISFIAVGFKSVVNSCDFGDFFLNSK